MILDKIIGAIIFVTVLGVLGLMLWAFILTILSLMRMLIEKLKRR